MIQAGPVANVHLPKDRVSMTHQGYGFCEFLTEEDADYACKIMNQIKLFGKPIRVNKASSDKREVDIGANLFIGNLDSAVDERMLFDTFMSFGTLVKPAMIARDTTTGASKGYGFVSFDSFEASDAAIEGMNGQYLANKPITVQYAFKKDTKGERHGTTAERLLAQQARKNHALPSNLLVGALAQPQAGMPQAQPYGGYPGAQAVPPPPPPPMGFAPQQQPYAQPGYSMPAPMMPGYAQAPMPNAQMGMPPPPVGFGQPQQHQMPPPPPPVGFGR